MTSTSSTEKRKMEDFSRGWLQAVNDWQRGVKPLSQMLQEAQRKSIGFPADRFKQGYFRALENIAHDINSPQGL